MTTTLSNCNISTFDIEVYKDIDDNYNGFIGYKNKGEYLFFKEFESFKDRIIEDFKENPSLILTGFHIIMYDLIMLSLWKYEEVRNCKNIFEKLKNYSDLLINFTNGKHIKNIYSLIKLLKESGNIEYEKMGEIISSQHPSTFKGSLFTYRGSNEFSLIKIYDLRAIPALQNGSLKINSLQNGDDFYIDFDIPDFSQDVTVSEDEMKEYCKKDLDATESLSKKHITIINATLQMCYEFDVKDLQVLNVVDISKVVGRREKIVSNSIHVGSYSKIPDQFLEWERDIFSKKGISPDEQSITISKTYKNHKKPIFVINRMNKNGTINKGGLHEALDHSIIESDTDTFCCDCDFSLLYSYVMLSENCPVLSEEGKAIVNNRIEVRKKLKEEKNSSEMCYKLLNNSTYGLLSYFFDSKSKGYEYVIDYVTTLAQLSIIDFLNFICENLNIGKIINLNTDGVFFSCNAKSKEEIIEVIDRFNDLKLIPSKINITFYKSITVFNTNSYIKEAENGDITMKGNSVHSSKNNKVVKDQVTKFTHYPLFVNLGLVLKEYIKAIRKNNLSLANVTILESIPSLTDEVLKVIKPLFYYKNTISPCYKLHGRLLDGWEFLSGSLCSKNFEYTEDYMSNREFLIFFMSGYLGKFFKYNEELLIQKFNKGHVFSELTHGKDVSRQYFLNDGCSDKPIIFANSLTYIYSVLIKQKKINIEKGIKLKKNNTTNPIELLEDIIEKPSLYLSSTMANSRLFSKYGISVLDFDFKTSKNLNKREQFINELLKFIDENSTNILYAEWHNTIDINRGKNGVHLLVINKFCSSKVCKDFLKTWECVYDTRSNKLNIILYSKEDLYTHNSIDMVVKYFSLLFSNFFSKELSGEQIIVKNAQSTSKKKIVTCENKLNELTEKYKNVDILRIFFEKSIKTFSKERSKWFKELSILRNSIYTILYNYAKINNNLLLEIIKDFLIFQCLSCPKTGLISSKFSIDDVIKSCEYLTSDGFDATKINKNKSYSEILNNLFDIDNIMFYSNIINNYLTEKDNDQGRSNSEHTSDTIDDCRSFCSNEREFFKGGEDSRCDMSMHRARVRENLRGRQGKTRDNNRELEFISKILVPDENYKSVDKIDYDESGTISFYKSPTGGGKTSSIISMIKNNHDKFKSGIIVKKHTTIYSSVTKIELDDMYNRIKNIDNNILIVFFTSQKKQINMIENEYMVPDVVLTTSAYLKYNIDKKFNKFITERKGNYTYVVDEFDKSLDFMTNYEVLAKPCKIDKIEFTPLEYQKIQNKIASTLEPVIRSDIDKLTYENCINDLSSFLKTSVVTPYQGYKKIQHKGDCYNEETGTFECITKLKNLNYVSSQSLNKKFHDYDKTIYVNTSFNENITLPKIKANLYTDSTLITNSYNIYDNIQSTIFNNNGIKIFKIPNGYLTNFVRCDIPDKFKYLLNGKDPCGTLKTKCMFYDTFKKISDFSKQTILLSATSHLGCEIFFNNFNVDKYSLESKDSTLIKNVNVEIYLNMFPPKIDDKHKINENDEVEIDKFTFLNKGRGVNIKKENVNLDKTTYYDIPSKKTFIGKLAKKDNILIVPDVDETPNVVSFLKSSSSRSVTLAVKTLSIELGNTSVIDDIFFFQVLETKLQGDSDITLDDVINIYVDYNNNQCVNNAIQSVGRCLREYYINGKVNNDGRVIQISSTSANSIEILKVLKNIYQRSEKSTFKITNIANGEDITKIVKLFS